MSEICAIIVCRLYLNYTIFKNACRMAPKDLNTHWRSTPWNPGSLPSRGPAPCRPYRCVDLPLTQTCKTLLPWLFLIEHILVQTFSSISDLLSDKQMHMQANMFYSFIYEFIFGHIGSSRLLVDFLLL